MQYPFRIYCDIESTGFDPIRNDIVSLAMIVTDDELDIKEEFYSTVKPDFNTFYSEDAEEIHGFSKDDMKHFKDPRGVCIDLLKFLKPFKNKNNRPRLFIYHALRQFDYLFVDWMFRKQDLQYSLWKVIEQGHQRSTILEARKLGYKQNGLDQWSKRINFDLTHHDALSDTKCCLEVDKYLWRNYGRLDQNTNGASGF